MASRASLGGAFSATGAYSGVLVFFFSIFRMRSLSIKAASLLPRHEGAWGQRLSGGCITHRVVNLPALLGHVSQAWFGISSVISAAIVSAAFELRQYGAVARWTRCTIGECRLRPAGMGARRAGGAGTLDLPSPW